MVCISKVSRMTLALALTTGCAAASAPAADAASYRSCKPVVNPFAGTRYDGVDLTKVRALRVSCTTARKVAKGAEEKALGITPPVSGIRRFTWHGWKVVGDLRGNSDRYVASRPGGKRVLWRF